jgi:hypothetical protein
MRAGGARWIGLLMLAVCCAVTATQAGGSDGRWKLGGDGVCYFDPTDVGADQCSPEPGRWKLGGDGSCYFDAADDGPDQCTPTSSSDAEIAADDEVMVLSVQDLNVGSVSLDHGAHGSLQGPRATSAP